MEDVAEALRSAIHSPSSTKDDKLAYMWVYFGLDWWKCNDCQDLMRVFKPENLTISADGKISATDNFPHGPEPHRGVTVTLSSTGQVVTLSPNYQLSLGCRKKWFTRPAEASGLADKRRSEALEACWTGRDELEKATHPNIIYQ